jgi:ankyrin repeat protein
LIDHYDRHAAVSYGHTELIQFLLSSGANPNLRDFDGDTPLHFCEDPEVAEFLLSHGADPTVVNNEGDTLFDKAEEDENQSMIEYWTSKGLANRGPNNPGGGDGMGFESIEEGGEEENEEDCEDIDTQGGV